MSAPVQLSLMKSFVSAVKALKSIDELRSDIEEAKFPMKSVTSWTDIDHYDLLHHAIISSHIEAVRYLLLRGYFQAPHEPYCHPYLHLAASVGHPGIVQLLMEQRPADYRKIHFCYPNGCCPRCCRTNYLTSEAVLPQALAARGKHLKCVEVLLFRNAAGIPHQDDHHDFYDRQAATTSRSSSNKHVPGLLELACVSQSTDCISLILEESNPSQRDISDALNFALKHRHPECMSLLFEGVAGVQDANSASTNFYHLLFACTNGYQPLRHQTRNLLESTKVLTRFVDVNCGANTKNHSLFSLIDQGMLYNTNQTLPKHYRNNPDVGRDPFLDCMELLLALGVTMYGKVNEEHITDPHMFWDDLIAEPSENRVVTTSALSVLLKCFVYRVRNLIYFHSDCYQCILEPFLWKLVEHNAHFTDANDQDTSIVLFMNLLLQLVFHSRPDHRKSTTVISEHVQPHCRVMSFLLSTRWNPDRKASELSETSKHSNVLVQLRRKRYVRSLLRRDNNVSISYFEDLMKELTQYFHHLISGWGPSYEYVSADCANMAHNLMRPLMVSLTFSNPSSVSLVVPYLLEQLEDKQPSDGPLLYLDNVMYETIKKDLVDVSLSCFKLESLCWHVVWSSLGRQGTNMARLPAGIRRVMQKKFDTLA